MRFSSAESTVSFFFRRRSRLADLPRMMCCLPALPRRTRPDPVARKRFRAARLVFIFGIGVSSLERGSSAHAVPRGEGACLGALGGYVKPRGEEPYPSPEMTTRSSDFAGF